VKIAFTTSGETLSAALDARFGRAPKFLIYDTDKDDFEVIDNSQNVNAAQGAGVQAAETIVRSGSVGLVTGNCGPKAFRVLAVAGVEVYNTDAPTVAEALDRYRSGKLTPARSANVAGHWA
jgi:predicted Fe-Mo cluster-binding NifX family protein